MANDYAALMALLKWRGISPIEAAVGLAEFYKELAGNSSGEDKAVLLIDAAALERFAAGGEPT